jgi:hypothetical protein
MHFARHDASVSGSKPAGAARSAFSLKFNTQVYRAWKRDLRRNGRLYPGIAMPKSSVDDWVQTGRFRRVLNSTPKDMQPSMDI